MSAKKVDVMSDKASFLPEHQQVGAMRFILVVLMRHSC
jgi:hypothetical protein